MWNDTSLIYIFNLISIKIHQKTYSATKQNNGNWQLQIIQQQKKSSVKWGLKLMKGIFFHFWSLINVYKWTCLMFLIPTFTICRRSFKKIYEAPTKGFQNGIKCSNKRDCKVFLNWIIFSFLNIEKRSIKWTWKSRMKSFRCVNLLELIY